MALRNNYITEAIVLEIQGINNAYLILCTILDDPISREAFPSANRAGVGTVTASIGPLPRIRAVLLSLLVQCCCWITRAALVQEKRWPHGRKVPHWPAGHGDFEAATVIAGHRRLNQRIRERSVCVHRRCEQQQQRQQGRESDM
jgi:hypothetical protein